jgi:hypothetical protein
VSVPTDPVAIIDTLDADAIAERLEQLDRERDALRVLLRSARARQRAAARRQPAPEREGGGRAA